jgi:hypothetical protein
MKKDNDMTLDEKLDLIANGEMIELTKEEALLVGAFEETALSEKDAQESRFTPNIDTDTSEILDIPAYVTMPIE